MFAFLAFFVLGMLTGAVMVIMSMLYMARKTLKLKKVATSKFLEEIDKLTEDLEKRSTTVNERLTRVKEIVNEQFDLQSQAEGPQKNAMDGKYKNSIVRTVKSLEEEKHTILKSIISDGFDPKVTVLGPDGVVTEMKLSEFMVQAGIDVTPTKTDDSVTKSGKFIVFKGGKDDSEGTSH
jgi:predicted RND superfamily exporter protein